MSFKQLGTGLGYFSLALGAAEVLAPGRMARALGLSDKGRAKGVIRVFGLREIAAGTMLLRGPAVSFNAWNRVIGDAIDATALALAVRGSSRKQAVVGAMAIVGAAAIVDTVAAIGLDNETGRTFPRIRPSEDTRNSRLEAVAARVPPKPELAAPARPELAAVPLTRRPEATAVPLIARPEPTPNTHENSLAATPLAAQ